MNWGNLAVVERGPRGEDAFLPEPPRLPFSFVETRLDPRRDEQLCSRQRWRRARWQTVRVSCEKSISSVSLTCALRISRNEIERRNEELELDASKAGARTRGKTGRKRRRRHTLKDSSSSTTEGCPTSERKSERRERRKEDNRVSEKKSCWKGKEGRERTRSSSDGKCLRMKKEYRRQMSSGKREGEREGEEEKLTTTPTRLLPSKQRSHLTSSI